MPSATMRPSVGSTTRNSRGSVSASSAGSTPRMGSLRTGSIARGRNPSITNTAAQSTAIHVVTDHAPGRPAEAGAGRERA